MINLLEGKVTSLFPGWKVRPGKYRKGVTNTACRCLHPFRCVVAWMSWWVWAGGGVWRGNDLHTVGLEWIWIEELCREDKNERKGRRKEKRSFPWLGEGDGTGGTGVKMRVSGSDLSHGGKGELTWVQNRLNKDTWQRGRKGRGSWRLGIWKVNPAWQWGWGGRQTFPFPEAVAYEYPLCLFLSLCKEAFQKHE